jgi:hypothetical protein
VDDHQCGDITKLKIKSDSKYGHIFPKNPKKYGHILRGKILHSPYLGDMGFRRSPNYRRVQKVFYFSLWATYPNLQLIHLFDDHLCG